MMKRLILLMVCISLPAQALTLSGQARMRPLESAALPAIRPFPVQYFDLSNGWHVILLEDPSLPLVSASVMIRSGGALVPMDQLGVGGITMQVLRSGGSEAHAPRELDALLDLDAIEIHGGMTDDSASWSLNTLSTYDAKAFKNFFDLFFRPRFDPNAFVVAKKRRLDDLRRQNDTPGNIAQREFASWVYDGSVWGTSPTQKTVLSLTLEDCKSLYRTQIAPHEKWLVVTGDITRDRLQTLLTEAMPLDPGPPTTAVYPKWEAKSVPGVRLVKKKTSQSVVVMGHVSTDRYNPDKYALMVMNDLLGGSFFTSRLMRVIRTEKGLAYQVSSRIGFGSREAPGTFQAIAKTQAPKTAEVVRLMRQMIADVHHGEGLTEKEVALSKQAILSSTLFEVSTPASAASQAARYAYYGFPRDYTQLFRREIMKVTLADVRRVAKQYLHPDQLFILVVGNTDLAKPLAEFGKVEVVAPSE